MEEETVQSLRADAQALYVNIPMHSQLPLGMLLM